MKRIEHYLISFIILFIFNLFYGASASFPETFTKHSFMGNIGHQFVSHSPIMDYNGDGSADILLSSIDGELLLIDVHQMTSARGHWPTYAHGEHFFASPIVHYPSTKGSILFISHKGNIYHYLSEGYLMQKTSLPTINETISNLHLHVDEMSSSAADLKLEVELHPEIYSSGVYCDMNNDGKVDELVLPVNYVDRNRTFIIAAVVIIDMINFNVLDKIFLERSKLNYLKPSYLLADLTHYTEPDDLHGGPLQSTIIASVTSGRIYSIHWNSNNGGDQLVLNDRFPITVDGVLTTAVIKDSNNALLLAKADSGTVYAWKLKSMNLLWKYDAIRSNKHNTSTTPLILHSASNAVYFATSTGLLHGISLTNGDTLKNFPLKLSQEKSFVAAGMIYESMGNDYLSFLSEDGELCSVQVSGKEIESISDIVVYKSHLNVSSRLAPQIVKIDSRESRLVVVAKDGNIHFFHPHSTTLTHSKDEILLLGIHEQSGPHSSHITATGQVVSMPFTFHVAKEGLDTKDFILHVQVHGGSSVQLIHRTKLSARDVTIDVNSRIVSGSLTIPFTFNQKTSIRPFRGRIWITMCLTKHYSITSICSTDSFRLSLNWEYLYELYWLLALPYSAALFALVLHLLQKEATTDSVPLYVAK